MKRLLRDAGNAAVDTASSRCAAPALRYGPAGDTAPPAAYQLEMAASKLAAIPGPAGMPPGPMDAYRW